jgi:pimeloyl-ACP methyl ester carboxylesterase
MQSDSLPLVLIPGLVCDEAVWKAQIAAFSPTRHVIVADHKNLDSLTDMARNVLARAPRQFALVGHSMGGRVALEILRIAPDRVRQLALLDTGFAPRATGEAGEQEAAKRYALLDIAKTQGMRAMGIEWARGMVHPDRLSDAVLMSEIHDMISRKTVEQFAAQIRALLARPDAADVLAAIRCPTLVLSGRQDSWSPWEQHVEIARRVRNCELVAIERCGHMSTMEQPEQVTAALRTFLDAA